VLRTSWGGQGNGKKESRPFIKGVRNPGRKSDYLNQNTTTLQGKFISVLKTKKIKTWGEGKVKRTGMITDVKKSRAVAFGNQAHWLAKGRAEPNVPGGDPFGGGMSWKAVRRLFGKKSRSLGCRPIAD